MRVSWSARKIPLPSTNSRNLQNLQNSRASGQIITSKRPAAGVPLQPTIQDDDQILCILINSLPESVSLTVRSWTPGGPSFLDCLHSDLRPNGRISFVTTIRNDTAVECCFGVWTLESVAGKPALTPKENLRQAAQRNVDGNGTLPPWFLSCSLVTSVQQNLCSYLSYPDNLESCLALDSSISRFTAIVRAEKTMFPDACTILAPQNDAASKTEAFWSLLDRPGGLEHVTIPCALFWDSVRVADEEIFCLDRSSLTLMANSSVASDEVSVIVGRTSDWPQMIWRCRSKPLRTSERWQVIYVVVSVSHYPSVK